MIPFVNVHFPLLFYQENTMGHFSVRQTCDNIIVYQFLFIGILWMSMPLGSALTSSVHSRRKQTKQYTWNLF